MKILGIDTSAKTSSVGIVEDGKVVDEVFVNEGLTHSETIMPMIDKLLNTTLAVFSISTFLDIYSPCEILPLVLFLWLSNQFTALSLLKLDDRV